MCGICGHFQPEPDTPSDRPLLRRMNAAIRHRGPDSEGYFEAGQIGMGVRRLAIIDIAGGDQPISNEDGTITVTYNGELYNFADLRTELESHGHDFATQSDTEVIVHAYEQWGEDALLRFNGMFAFALWDGPRRRLLIARDRMGEKPLYWHFSKHGLLWASEAKAILEAPWVDRELNPLSVHHYLTLQYTPDPLTIYRELQQLPAAHKLIIEADGRPIVTPWWHLSFEPKWEITPGEARERARSLLRSAVRQRLISEVPLGAFLSGGIDSSVVVALMSEAASQPVKTFSIGFPERAYTETQFARQVAERFGTEHHEFIFEPADLTRVIEGVIDATDEPLADPAAMPLYELARMARDYVTVALSGDGGDETLAGYPRYALDRLLQPYAALPAWVTRRAVPAIADWLPEPGWLPEDRNPLTGLKRLRQFSATTPKASLVRWGSYFSHDEKLALYTDKMRTGLAEIDTSAWVARAFDQAQASNQLDRTLYADQVTYLAGDLLPKTDRTTMAHSLEARAPFLDVEWVEWTARLPTHFKARGLSTKWLLKEAFADLLPAAVLSRGKQGFSVPLGPWLNGELRSWMHAHLLESSRLRQWIQPPAIRALIAEHQRGKVNHGKKLWALLLLAVWLERR